MRKGGKKFLFSKNVDYAIFVIGIILILVGVFTFIFNIDKLRTRTYKKIYPTPFITTDLSEYSYYQGQVSPRVPYKGLQFLEVDPYDFTPIRDSLDKNDYHFEGYVVHGYTFTAKKGDTFDFYAKEEHPWDDPTRSFIETELYGWGPTVIKMGTRIGWGVPVDGRYFYVVRGFPEEDNPDNRYGNYTLTITKRE